MNDETRLILENQLFLMGALNGNMGVFPVDQDLLKIQIDKTHELLHPIKEEVEDVF